MKYSASTGGFYESSGKNTPNDAVDITQEAYRSLLDSQSSGCYIAPDASGYPASMNYAPIDPKISIQAQITRLESAAIMPRVTREYMLLDLEDKAAKAGLDPMLLPAYARVKALDLQIGLLRDQL